MYFLVNFVTDTSHTVQTHGLHNAAWKTQTEQNN